MGYSELALVYRHDFWHVQLNYWISFCIFFFASPFFLPKVNNFLKAISKVNEL